MGPDWAGTPTARSFSSVAGLGGATSTPSKPSRSTTIAAPPPVVAITPTLQCAALTRGLRPTTSGAASSNVSR